MATDDLYAPLGLDTKPARGRRSVIYSVAAGLLGVALAVGVIWALAWYDPLGSRPTAAAKAELAATDVGRTAQLRPSETDLAPPHVTGSLRPEDNAPKVPVQTTETPPEAAPPRRTSASSPSSTAAAAQGGRSEFPPRRRRS